MNKFDPTKPHRPRTARWAIRALLGCACLAGAGTTCLAAEPPDPIGQVGFFGIGSCAANSRNHAQWIPQMQEIGIHDLRSFGNSWGGVEPRKGEWNFTAQDSRYMYLMSHGVRPGNTLDGWAGWSRGNAKAELPVTKLDEWSNYVFKMVEHGKGKIRHYEILNEPPNGTGNAPPSDYAKLVVAAYDAAKKADPEAMIGLATKSAHTNYLDQVIRAGAKDHFPCTLR